MTRQVYPRGARLSEIDPACRGISWDEWATQQWDRQPRERPASWGPQRDPPLLTGSDVYGMKGNIAYRNNVYKNRLKRCP